MRNKKKIASNLTEVESRDHLRRIVAARAMSPDVMIAFGVHLPVLPQNGCGPPTPPLQRRDGKPCDNPDCHRMWTGGEAVTIGAVSNLSSQWSIEGSSGSVPRESHQADPAQRLWMRLEIPLSRFVILPSDLILNMTRRADEHDAGVQEFMDSHAADVALDMSNPAPSGDPAVLGQVVLRHSLLRGLDAQGTVIAIPAPQGGAAPSRRAKFRLAIHSVRWALRALATLRGIEALRDVLPEVRAALEAFLQALRLPWE